MFGIAARISRISSHGSSRWKRTDTAMCVLDVKSSAWKPSALHRRRDREDVVRGEAGRAPEALVAVARRRVDDLDDRAISGLHPEERLAVLDELPVLDVDLDDRAGDARRATEFIIFITSMMQTIVSGSTGAPTSTNGAAPGAGAR